MDLRGKVQDEVTVKQAHHEKNNKDLDQRPQTATRRFGSFLLMVLLTPFFWIMITVVHLWVIICGRANDRKVIIPHMETEELARRHKSNGYNKRYQTKHSKDEVRVEGFKDFEKLHPGSVQPDVIDFSQFTKKKAAAYMYRNEPVIIDNVPEGMFDTICNFREEEDKEKLLAQDKILVDMKLIHTKKNVGVSLWNWVVNTLGRSRLWPFMATLRFRGRYGGVIAHIDAGSTYNIYYVNSGIKRVRIWPRQHNPDIIDKISKGGVDNTYIPVDKTDDSALDAWYYSCPTVWEFHVRKNQILLFANAGCLHKFCNATDAPDIVSMRTSSKACAKKVAWHMLFHWEQARHVARMTINNIVLKNQIKRDPSYV